MARIKIRDLPSSRKLTREDMKLIAGGFATSGVYLYGKKCSLDLFGKKVSADFYGKKVT